MTFLVAVVMPDGSYALFEAPSPNEAWAKASRGAADWQEARAAAAAWEIGGRRERF